MVYMKVLELEWSNPIKSLWLWGTSFMCSLLGRYPTVSIILQWVS